MEGYRLPIDKERKLLVKSEDSTNPDYGIAPNMRPVREYLDKGFINLDKPAGPTSHEVVAWVKKILKIRKAGHSGTLDPQVTGVLPVLLSKGTKLIQALLNTGKEYIVLMRLHNQVSEAKLREAISLFKGRIYQRPPVRSSVKRELRIRTVYYIDLLEVSGRDALMVVGCEAGTYARKLVYDIGEVLGCGAHMQELRRTRSGPHKEDETLKTLHDLLDAYKFYEEEGDEKTIKNVVQPMENAIPHIPKIIIRDSAVDAICHGAALAAPGVLKVESDIQPNDIVAFFTLKGEIIALGRSLATSKQILEMDHGLVALTDSVLMETGTYPPSWKP
ncbi:MAG: RNA-guided pseudouridylation complex pseudouridine synthase subunit Cbf5 [Candidatus Odinarchaeum yellowstonii]|uniref:Probable tRNA pseudouridine synthase B n=1 Tax=Odinarchaeota yellowstonii (strain LCB_4) TaxID=1841599 RepID=A0AAF0IAU7_ODILC|nr:MAG: RNA-guided pseudouridylation complex pseudouridine synthase subunit Cbf5 [Candidatus Odinarchaeum yellowstonii]